VCGTNFVHAPCEGGDFAHLYAHSQFSLYFVVLSPSLRTSIPRFRDLGSPFQ